MRQGLCAWSAFLMFAQPAFADCPIELATYADRDKAAEINFTPVKESATVTNSFRLLLDNNVVLDGIVMWTQEEARPMGQLMYKCPEGDVTGAEIEACTLWQGVVYAVDEKGEVGLMPHEGPAPAKLLFPDLGPLLKLSPAYSENAFSKVPWDVFSLNGCQE